MKLVSKEDWPIIVSVCLSSLFVFLSASSAYGVFSLGSALNLGRVIFLILIVGGCFASGLIRWRFNVQLVFFFVVIEGAVRKWILPDQSSMIYFVKDCLIISSLPGYWLWKKRQKKQRDSLMCWQGLKVCFLLFFGYCLLQLLNPQLSHAGIGLMGIKAYCVSIPLVFLTRDLFDDEASLSIFLRQFIVFSIPIFILGIMQFYEPPSHVLNRYAWGEDRIAIFGSARYPRVTGTFSYITGMASYVSVIFCLAVSSVLSKNASFFWITCCYAVLAFSIGNMLMTGSRLPVVQAIVYLCILFLVLIKNAIHFVIRYSVRLILIAGLILLVGLKFFPTALESFNQRVVKAGYVDAQDRIKEAIRFPELEYGKAGLFGYGIGTTQQASTQLLNALGLDSSDYAIDIDYEEEPERVMLELGLLGFLLFYLLKLMVVFCGWDLFSRARASSLKWFAFGLFAFLLVNSFNPLVFNHVLNIFYWYGLGLLAAIARLSSSSYETRKG